MQAFNPKFQVADPGSVKCYTMDPSSFQQSLSEQVNSQESVHKAITSFCKSRSLAPASSGTKDSFFQSSPSQSAGGHSNQHPSSHGRSSQAHPLRQQTQSQSKSPHPKPSAPAQ
ncbi:hypothetical protein CLU79DRAFT_861860 [Phycomyces nitens]|nr:hypothetical protein CLU79DRAFT_861860 [Phycomyces nitens]